MPQWEKNSKENFLTKVKLYVAPCGPSVLFRFIDPKALFMLVFLIFYLFLRYN